MIEWLFTFLVFYLLYRLIFDFILPVSRVSAHVRNKVNEMNRQQQEQPNSNQTYSTSKQTTKPPADDYIDFEEIK
ncbi:MAG TPA: hypothetical protein VHB70_18115 [Parafilimonas sp.]|nr:hypothetical protein [Parafilimonas sp.]